MSEWQTMDTAPRDGTWVLLTGGNIRYGWDGDDQPAVVAAQYSTWLNGRSLDEGRWQFAWYDGGYYGAYEDPAMWMPLPVKAAEPAAE